MPKEPTDPFSDAAVEQLAALTHEAWAGWMRSLFKNGIQEDDGCFLIPPGRVRRWRRQMETPYHDLPDAERERNRDEARKYLRALYVPLVVRKDTQDDA